MLKLETRISIHSYETEEGKFWIDTLVQMYTKWAERHGYTFNITYDVRNQQHIAHIVFADSEVMDKLTIETGRHRFCRIPPYDLKQRRYTSFVLVDVHLVLNDTILLTPPDETKFKALKRSYILDPYQSITDVQLNIKSSNVDAVLNGEIDCFLKV